MIACDSSYSISTGRLGRADRIHHLSRGIHDAQGDRLEGRRIGGDLIRCPGSLALAGEPARQVVIHRLLELEPASPGGLSPITRVSSVRRRMARHVVADEQHRAPLLGHVAHLAQAFALELGVADRQHLVHDQDFRLQVRGHREGQPHVHPAGVALDRGVDELLDFGEGDDLVEFARRSPVRFMPRIAPLR